MAAEDIGKSSREEYSMKGGNDVYSYANNSSYQRGVIGTAKELITDAIAEKLDFNNIVLSNTFRIADLGCSVGPNTFFAIQNIIEAVQCKGKCQGLDPQLLEFQVFFNDHTSNDFNTLFKSLPPDGQYYAAGVAGSFYCHLFPNSSLHFVHSSYAIHWLSKVPELVVDKTSPAWNKGRIYIVDSEEDVVKAYEAQYAEDMECFLHARAQEVVCGGLIALIFAGRPNGAPHSQTPHTFIFNLLGSCLMDMARKSKVSEEKVDSFNIPTYWMSPQELEAAVHRNGEFRIERMEKLPGVINFRDLSKSQVIASNLRAVLEGLIKAHFGDVILEELFELFRNKVEEQLPLIMSFINTDFFALLKRKVKD
ncbi:loganic acid O-methyltransferase-like [Carya illinoinensis]|uniref:Uncharacterized protein n=1 Tax=Carya illinoinensis TaxID=32201 RepID=A0A8T1N7C3_CARIL|nr:loganic acid O-methyltransferase-like [Carya illinoinensis]KAG6625358.1 hypothetical protein CIPAW_16G090400 [Carya illinoinensis]